MHLLDQRMLGMAMLLLLGMLVIVKRAATGCVLDKPKGDFLVQLVNVFNLFFLLVVNPAAAILLISGRLPAIDPFNNLRKSSFPSSANPRSLE